MLVIITQMPWPRARPPQACKYRLTAVWGILLRLAIVDSKCSSPAGIRISQQLVLTYLGSRCSLMQPSSSFRSKVTLDLNLDWGLQELTAANRFAASAAPYSAQAASCALGHRPAQHANNQRAQQSDCTACAAAVGQRLNRPRCGGRVQSAAGAGPEVHLPMGC